MSSEGLGPGFNVSCYLQYNVSPTSVCLHSLLLGLFCSGIMVWIFFPVNIGALASAEVRWVKVWIILQRKARAALEEEMGELKSTENGHHHSSRYDCYYPLKTA